MKSEKMSVLLLENIHPDAVAHFKDAGFTVETYAKAMSEDELLKALKGVSIVGIRSKTKITEKVLEAHPQLLAIGAFCIGTNQIDLHAATRLGIPVFNAPYSNTRSVVELVIGEIVMLMRKIFDGSNTVHAGGWAKSATGCFEIRGKKLGIIGYGNIGSQLSVVAEACGMQVAFYDIAEKLALGNAKRMKSLHDVLEWADVVTLHVDGRKENEKLIDEKAINAMKKGSYLINNARGNVVDVEALARALRKGNLAGAAVDVFPKEPKGNDEQFSSPLQRLPNVILTPHIGGSTEEAQRDIGNYTSQKLIQYVRAGDTSINCSLPQLSIQRMTPKTFRFVHIHKNVHGMLAAINEILAERKVNIVGQLLKTNEVVGYVVTDCAGKAPNDLINALESIPGTIKTHCITGN